MLPETGKMLAYEIIKKLVLAWDPDYTKLTALERKELEKIKREVNNGETIDFNHGHWN